MPPSLVDDDLWELIEPLLPKTTRRYRHPGRRRIHDRKVLSGILIVLSTGIAWQRLPQELGFGSGMTCWRRLLEWQQAGVWQRLHELQGLRLRVALQVLTRTRNHARSRQAQHQARIASRPRTLGRRADALLVTRVPAPTHSL
jgi:transposase